MELRVLKYFLTVAKEGNITKAADILYITQPTLSRQLAALEDEFGKELFLRGGGKKFTLTEAGLLLKRRAEEIVELADKASVELRETGELIEGTVSISSAESHSAKIIARVMENFKSNFPSVKFDIFSSNAETVKERVDKGLADFGIIIEPNDCSKYETFKIEETEQWGLLMRSDFYLASKNFIAQSDIMDLSLLVSKQATDSGELKMWYGDGFDKLKIISTYNLVNNAAMLVDAGLGCAIVIDGAVNFYDDRKLKFIPFVPMKKNSSLLIWKKYQPHSAVCRKFIEIAAMLLKHKV